MNARSVRTVNSKVNKLAVLQTLVSLTDWDILCITETWLNDRVANAEILHHCTLKLYQIFFS